MDDKFSERKLGMRVANENTEDFAIKRQKIDKPFYRYFFVSKCKKAEKVENLHKNQIIKLIEKGE